MEEGEWDCMTRGRLRVPSQCLNCMLWCCVLVWCKVKGCALERLLGLTDINLHDCMCLLLVSNSWINFSKAPNLRGDQTLANFFLNCWECCLN